MSDLKRKSPPDLIKESGWTIDDYLKLPEDGNQYEIVNGILELKPSPTTTHQRICQRIEQHMTNQCSAEYIIIFSPVDVLLAENETRQPDIVMIHRSREEIIEERGVVGPPDLVVEILSPNSAKRDRVQKKETYARFNIPEYWIVDHVNQTIEQYILKEAGQPYQLIEVYGSDDTFTSSRIPCLSFRIGEVLKIR